MNKMIRRLMALCLLAVSFAAFAQSSDTMKQDNMKHDDMQQDQMKNDRMKKDDTKKDAKSKKTKKDKTKKDDMKKDDNMKHHDTMKHDEPAPAFVKFDFRVAGAGNITGYLETSASAPVQKICAPPCTRLPEGRLDDWHQHKLRLGGQILLHTAHARGVPLSQRFPGLDGLNVCFVVDEGTPSCVKRFPIRRNHHHHIRGHAGTRPRMFGTQGRTAEDGRSGHLKAAGDQDCRCSSDHPSEKASPVTRHILFQPPV